MATTQSDTVITWGVADMERQLGDGCVTTVHWTVEATDGQHNAHAYGSIGLEPPEGELIPFEDLTPEVACSWVKEQLGEEATAMEESLCKQLAFKRAPKTANGLPWQDKQEEAEVA